MVECWNPSAYQEKGSFVPALGEPLLGLLKPKPGMRVLDLGCGDGTLSLKIMAAGATLIGIDASADMVEAAQEKGIDAHFIDAHELRFQDAFDAVFSNAALHWMTENPAKVVQNVFNALKPGGIFVGEMGGEGNIAEILSCQRMYLEPLGIDLDTISPKFFPSEQMYSTLLQEAGFTVKQMELFKRPTPLPAGVSGWLEVFSRKVLNALPPEQVTGFLQQVENCTKPTLYSEEHGWQADYVRLRFVAQKPA
jgi:trans-aconitate methyltransferase